MAVARTPDLVTRLQSAASDAIASQRRELSINPGNLRSLTLELRLKKNGDDVLVDDIHAYTERRVQGRKSGGPA